jgi:hypothetical protein
MIKSLGKLRRVEMNIQYYTHNSQSLSFIQFMSKLNDYAEKVELFYKFQKEDIKNKKQDNDDFFKKFNEES